MKCRVIINGARGLVGDVVEYTGDPERLPHTLVPLPEEEQETVEKGPSQEDFQEAEGGGAEDIRKSQLRAVLNELDHDDPEHWTESGQPSMSVFNQAALRLGVPDATRAELRSLLGDEARRREE